MKAFFWGASGRRLFGVFHSPELLRPGQALAVSDHSPEPAAAVLICGPHGQEALRAHRLLRVLAERLARSGHPVLRFDPYGSGDSEGDDPALDLAGWVADVRSASAQLSRLTHRAPQIWIGLRLGAAVACRAAVSAPAARADPSAQDAVSPQHLLLCEPVLHGQAYLDTLARATVQTLEASFSIRDAQWRHGLHTQPHVLEREAIGFALGEALHQQLRGLRAAHVVPPLDSGLAVIMSHRQRAELAEVGAWAAQHPCAECQSIAYDFDWTAEEALNTALVPHALVHALQAAVSCRPVAAQRAAPSHRIEAPTELRRG